MSTRKFSFFGLSLTLVQAPANLITELLHLSWNVCPRSYSFFHTESQKERTLEKSPEFGGIWISPPTGKQRYDFRQRLTLKLIDFRLIRRLGLLQQLKFRLVLFVKQGLDDRFIWSDPKN
jgi:hypothetical protein